MKPARLLLLLIAILAYKIKVKLVHDQPTVANNMQHIGLNMHHAAGLKDLASAPSSVNLSNEF